MSESLPSSSSSGAHFGLRERLFGIFALLILAWLALLPLRPPAVVGEDAPDTEFSAVRAAKHLETVAAAPHPVGSPELARVRDYLVEELKNLGLEPQIQHTTVRGSFRGPQVARVQNVMARLKGSGGGSTLLLMAHYDSVPRSPGANDDGSGVVALLETLRALRAGEPLQNDVIFLFTDAEEIGLLGARAFQEQHPWADEVDLVINFEARGGRGPSIMFETGPGTSPLLGRFADLAPYPVASSYSYDVYRRLPNNTDFTIFKDAGFPGFNFAYIHDLPTYHAAFDTADNINLRSVQHHGSYALALVRGFGAEDLENLPEQEVQNYFNLPFLGLVVYSNGFVLPLTVLAVLLTLAVLALGIRSGRLQPLRILLGLLFFPLFIAVVGAVVTFLHQGLFGALVDGRGALAAPAIYRLGLALLGLGLSFTLAMACRRKPGTAHLAAGALLGWSGLVIIAALEYQSSNYLLFWPLLAGALALHLHLRTPETSDPPLVFGLLLLALAIPALWLWIPMFSLIGAAFAGGAAMILAVLAGLLASILHPQIALLADTKRRFLLPAVLAVAGLALMLVQLLGAGYDAERPKTNSLFYALNAGADTAHWASLDRQADSWAAQYLGESPEMTSILENFFGDRFQVLAAEAPVIAVPELEIIDLDAPAATDDMDDMDDMETSPEGGDTAAALAETPTPTTTEGPRKLRLRLRPTGTALRINFRLRSPAPITSFTIDGQSLDLDQVRPPENAPPGFWGGNLYGDPGEGFEFVVELAEHAPLEIESVVFGDGLPEVPNSSHEPRPEHLQPHPYRFTDQSLVRQVHSF